MLDTHFNSSWVPSPDLTSEYATIVPDGATNIHLASVPESSDDFWCVVFFKAEGSTVADYVLAYKIISEFRCTLKANQGKYYVTHWRGVSSPLEQITLEYLASTS